MIVDFNTNEKEEEEEKGRGRIHGARCLGNN